MSNRHKNKLIVFDLDETLVHLTKDKLPFIPSGQFEDYYIYKRPSLDDFLAEISTNLKIAIWSSATDNYVRSVVDCVINKNIQLEFVWGRSECWIKIIKEIDKESGIGRKVVQNIKPLEKIRRLGYDMNKLLIIDDSHYKIKDNPENYYLIEPYEGDSNDNGLDKLLSKIREVYNDETFERFISRSTIHNNN